MREYLFVDQRRLGMYVSQLNPSLTILEKRKEIGAEVTLTGPKASAKQTETLRPMTIDEQVHVLTEHLKDKGPLRLKRPQNEEPGPVYVLERFRAIKVIVPRQEVGLSKMPEFTFWLSPGAPATEYPGMLCLLEDFDREDGPAISFHGASTYTLLQSLVYYTRDRLQKTVLADKIPNNPHPNPYAKFDKDWISLSEYHNVKDQCYDFVTDCNRLLESWGCLASPSREVESLYRIREFGRDSTRSWEVTTVFGYPIWMALG